MKTTSFGKKVLLKSHTDVVLTNDFVTSVRHQGVPLAPALRPPWRGGAAFICTPVRISAISGRPAAPRRVMRHNPWLCRPAATVTVSIARYRITQAAAARRCSDRLMIGTSVMPRRKGPVRRHRRGKQKEGVQAPRGKNVAWLRLHSKDV